MKLAIMQPYIFPYIGYFQLLNAVDKFVIYDDVNYINKGWINRNRILINGEGSLFTVPLVNASQNRLINDICINDSIPWARKLLKSIRLAYAKAPYFSEAFPLIERILLHSEVNISLFITNSLREVCQHLGIRTKIICSSSIYGNKELKGQQRIVDICRKEQASTYINPMSGAHLYDPEVFAKQGVQLRFITANMVSYTQFKAEFVPWLSIVDVLMFNSRANIKAFLKEYDLERKSELKLK